MRAHTWEDPEIYQIWIANQASQNDWPKETWKEVLHKSNSNCHNSTTQGLTLWVCLCVYLHVLYFFPSLDCKEIQPVHSKGNHSWVFFGRNDAKAETPVLWPPHVKSWLIGKDWFWEGLGAGREGDDRGWDGWMASPTWWMWVWVNSGSWWWTGRPGVLQFMWLQGRTGLSGWTELTWIDTLLASLLFSLWKFFSAKPKGQRPLSLTTGLVARVCCFHCCDPAQFLARNPSPTLNHCRPRSY